MGALAVLALVACDETPLAGAPAQPAPGSIVILDTGGPQGRTGWWPSLAIDGKDQAHLSYCDAHNGDLRYATNAGGAWRTEIVISEGAVGKYTAVGVDTRGGVGIAFYDQDTKYLRYAWREPGGAWQSEKIAWGLEIGMGAELRFDDADVPHLFYYVPSGRLVHAWKPAGKEWQKEEISKATGGHSVRISPVMRPEGFWLSFTDWDFSDTTLYLSRQRQGGFEHEVVDREEAPGWRSQLFFEGDAPWLLYTRNRTRQLRLAERVDGAWRSKLVVSNVGNFAAGRTSTGDIIAAYEDTGRLVHGKSDPGKVRLLRRRGGVWERYEVDNEAPCGSYMALATDSRGGFVLAYFSDAIRGLKIYSEGGAQSSGR